jgi:tryptophanyl-tRNA synthetase
MPGGDDSSDPSLALTDRLESYVKCLRELMETDVSSIMCLVPMAIDQSPYFRMAREMSKLVGCPRPATLHSEFLPGLFGGKMSSSTGVSSGGDTIFLDMTPKQISKSIRSNAYSGGQESLELHRRVGADITVDISYQYLVFFLESDEELERVAREYSSGRMLSSEVKDLAIRVVTQVVLDHQSRVAELTEDQLNVFFDMNRVLDIVPYPAESSESPVDVVPDRFFGCYSPEAAAARV